MFAGDIVRADNLYSTQEFLIALATPALLTSAVGSLVLSTSTRLGRVVDRVRDLEKRLSDLIFIKDKDDVPLYDKRVEVIVDLLDMATSRSRILQRALAMFYYGVGFFILTSVLIAIASLLGIYRWTPVPVGVVGIMFVFYGSILMIQETRMATATVNAEMDFTWELARTVAPENVALRYAKRGKKRGLIPARLRNVPEVPGPTENE